MSTENKSHKNRLTVLVSLSLSVCALSFPLSSFCVAENQAAQASALQSTGSTVAPPAQASVSQSMGVVVTQSPAQKSSKAKISAQKIPVQTSEQQAATAAVSNKQTVSVPTAPANTQTVFAKGQIYTKGVGLSKADLHLLNQGHFAELATQLSTKVSVANANRDTAWLAFTYLYLQQCDDVKRLADSYTNSDPNNVDINLILLKSFALLCDKKTDLAEKELQKIPAAAMNDAFVNYAFATLAGKQGKPQVAIAYAKRAVELAPDFAWGYRTIAFLQDKWLHQANEAKANYIKALVIEPKFSEASTALINLYIANNEYDQAIDIAKQAIDSNPFKGAVYCQLANIYIQQWRLNEAAQQIKKAISLESENSQYYRLLAFLLEKENKLAEAVNTQKKAVAHSEDQSIDLVRLAALQLENGQQDQAIASLKQAIETNPQNTIAISELTRLSIQMGKFDDLLTELNKCTAKFPKSELIKIQLGDAYAAAKQSDKAIAAYKAAANLNTGDPEPHTKIAALLISKEDYEGAAKEYTHALNISPNSAANLVALGSCEAQMDDYLKAEAAFVTALALHQLTQPIDSTVPPTRVDIIRGLATLLYKEGRYADATSQFMAVVEMDKNSAMLGRNKFMAAQALALRDLSKDSFKQLDQAYSNLSDDEKNGQKINYIDTLLRCKRYEEALSLLKGMAKTKDANPLAVINSPFYWICFSQAYLGKGDIINAKKAAQQAIDICEKDESPKSDAYCQLGEVLFANGYFDGAEKNADSAIGVNIRAFRAYVLLGNMAIRQKQTKLAVEAANKALEIDPYYIDAYLLLGKAQTAQGDYKGALTTYNKAVDLYPSLIQTHELLLATLQEIGTKEEIAREEAALAVLKSKQ